MQTKARTYGMKNRVLYEAKAEDNGISNNNNMHNPLSAYSTLVSLYSV